MKKIRRLIIIIAVLLIVAIGLLVGYHFSQQSEDASATTDSSSVLDADEYLLKNSNEKAPEKENSLWLCEKTDGDLNEENKNLSVIEKDIFNKVYIRSEYFADKKGENTSFLSEALSFVKEKGKTAVAVFDFSVSLYDIATNSKEADGIMLTGAEENSAKEINEKTADMKKYVKDKEITVALTLDCDYISELDAENIDAVYVLLSEKADSEKVRKMDETLIEKGISLVCGIDISAVDGKKVTADTPLYNLYALKDAVNIEERSFTSLKSVKKNRNNCYGAVKTYIEKGICPEIAFREVGIRNYEGETVAAEGFTAEFTVYGSNLYPVFINGENMGTPDKGYMSVKLDLDSEENTFTITQNENETEYKVNCVVDEDIVRFIMPYDEIEAQPKEKITVMVIAHCKAKISIKLGTEKFEAECDEDAEGYTAFVSHITMPDTATEVSSLGLMTVVAAFGDKTLQFEGPKIKPGQEMTTTVPVTEETAEKESDTTETRYDIGNYLPSIQNDIYAVTEKLTTTTTYTTTGVYQTVPYTGDQMCVVTSAYADTKPISSSDDFVPYYLPLIIGTMDYVTGESTAYNSDDNETEYYYELASGRKVKRDAVQIIPKTEMGSNNLGVVSCVNENGELKITLSTNWKVPYNLNYVNQNYYYGYKKQYNVTDFTSGAIEFTFYHTSSASGQIDTNGSDVVSSAVWNISGDTVKLTMPLRSAGGYYGSSIEYDANGNMVITINRKPTGASGAVVLLDPGHGGKDSGALGIGKQVYESDVNFMVAYFTMTELQNMGVTVYMTRYGDDYLDLEERKAIARSLKPDLFVSIHSNGSESSESIGTSTYYYKPFSFDLAKNVYDELLSVFRNSLYYGRQEVYNDIADGVRFYPFSVTRIETCPSILIETGYMTNDAECRMLIDTENQKKLGKAIADGIVKTLQS